ncbi:MAG TPA: hypothetical protein VHR66_21305 [Gemmataceae bacterium]|jgi:hypothetical protein|nr:hypothetical protein [Gemmataceae bacterium]
MLFRSVRAGSEVILATSTGRGAPGGFTYALAEVEAVKSSMIVVAGYKFNLKDGKGRTVPHYILPATNENRRAYLDGDKTAVASPQAATEAEAQVEDKIHELAIDALRIIREETTADDDHDLVDLFGADALAAFRRQWRRLKPRRE